MTISVIAPEVFSDFNFKAARFDKNHSRSDKISILVTWKTTFIVPEIKSKH